MRTLTADSAVFQYSHNLTIPPVKGGAHAATGLAPFVLEGRHAFMKGGALRATIIVRLFVRGPTAGEARGCGPRPSLTRK
jgi:hypothetical protein